MPPSLMSWPALMERRSSRACGGFRDGRGDVVGTAVESGWQTGLQLQGPAQPYAAQTPNTQHTHARAYTRLPSPPPHLHRAPHALEHRRVHVRALVADLAVRLRERAATEAAGARREVDVQQHAARPGELQVGGGHLGS